MAKTKTKKPSSASGKTNKTPKKKSSKTPEIVSICLAALSVIITVCVYTSGAGKLGNFISSVTRGIFGVGAYIIPIIIIGMVIHYFASKSEEKTKKYVLLGITLADLVALSHMIFAGNIALEKVYSHNLKHLGGGILGALIAKPLQALMENVCTYVVLIAVLAIMLVVIFDISFTAIIKSIFRKTASAIKEAKSNVEETKDDKKGEKPRTKEKTEDAPLPEPPPENAPWEPEVPVDMDDFEINIYNEKEETPEKISDDEKKSLQDEIENEIAEVGEIMEYTYPTTDLLDAPKDSQSAGDMSKELRENAAKLVEALRSFHVEAQVVEISCGPTVTRYEIKPAAGVKVSQITNLSKDIALKLAAKGGVMIAPVPGKSTIGIEIANTNPSTVTLREVIESEEFRNHKSKLAVALGKDISGAPVIMDIAKMPHLLIAGATGAGKSVCINTLIISLMYKADPNEVKLVMIDPKQVELGIYNGIPHLLIPVVKDAKKATGALSWAVQEMTERYSTFEKHNVRNIQGYNELMEAEGTPENKMASIVIIIDEFADLMMVAPGDVENYVCRIAQLARAAGMHLVIATQRPVVKFITGNIKANVPSRISFMVASAKDSMTILDMGGAEKLVGKGDMLYMPVGETKPSRMQCAFVSDADVKKVVDAVTENCEAAYDPSVIEQLEKEDEYKPDGEDPGDADELLPEAIEMAIDNGQISTSLLQRRFRIGYNRAGSIIDQMEARGIISGLDGNRPRQALITREQYHEMLMK